MKLGKYSFGLGDRFAHQGVAQLKAIIKAGQVGTHITPVWNKSSREHKYLHSSPFNVRKEADDAVAELGFKEDYFVDADHINLSTVESFVPYSDFFTLDVASSIGKRVQEADIAAFVHSSRKYLGNLQIPGMEEPLQVTPVILEEIAAKFLGAAEQASYIFQYLLKNKGEGNFITEVSMDEVEQPQSPVYLLFILKMLADKGVGVHTIAPKFAGRFNKGVDYRGDVTKFADEFEKDLLVIDFAVKEFCLPENLKLSVHSGSDKFSIYPILFDILKKHDKGLHIKTAGTTWLEEIIGLALSGGDGLKIAKKIYANSFNRRENLCAPYADVIDIDSRLLPSVVEVNGWSGDKYADTLRHVPSHPDYNPDFRQLMHVAYPVAAELGDEYYSQLKKNAEIIGHCVEENIYNRHLKRLFSL